MSNEIPEQTTEQVPEQTTEQVPEQVPEQTTGLGAPPEAPHIGESPFQTIFDNDTVRIEAAKVQGGVIVGHSRYGMCFVPGAGIVRAGNDIVIQ